jgi:hypothetical protein
MGRREWNNFVKKVYEQNKSKPGYSLGDAMKEASRMKKSGKNMSSIKTNTKSKRSKRGAKSHRRH